MALSFAHGAIQWLAADAATTVYTVSGLSFQPKAIRFYWCGLQSATDAASQAVNEQRGVGFCTGTSARRCVGSFSQDTAATSNCGTVARNDAVACTTDGAGGSDGELDINSITSDGFTLIVDDACPANLTIFWEAWGGDDITVATVGDIAEPAATGNVDYTVTGFVAGATDQVVMFAGVQSVAAVNTAEAEASGIHIGFASGGSAGENIVIAGNSDDASTAMDTDSTCLSGECIAMCAKAGAAVSEVRATLTQFGTDNFRLNWLERAVTSRRSIFMAIKGGAWRVGDLSIDNSAINNTATVSGLPFTPVGMSLMWRGTTENASDTWVTTDQYGLGTGTSTSSRRSMAVRDEDATASSACEIDTVLEYDQVLCYANSDGTSGRALDINAMNSDGFQLISDVSGGTATTWVGYVTFGSQVIVQTDGAISAQSSTLAGAGESSSTQTDGTIAAQAATVAGAGLSTSLVTDGAITSQNSTMDGEGVAGDAGPISGTGALASQAASLAGVGESSSLVTDGALTAQSSAVVGAGGSASLITDGAIACSASTMSGVGFVGEEEPPGGYSQYYLRMRRRRVVLITRRPPRGRRLYFIPDEIGIENVVCN